MPSRHFLYKKNSNNCKEIHGCAMCSPFAPVVANLSTEVIEESAKTTSAIPTIF